MTNRPVQKIVEEAEAELKEAMLASDVSKLDELLDEELRFTTHLGQIIGKNDDLSMHESGMLKIHNLELSDTKISVLGATAIVTTKAYIDGSFAGSVSKSDYRFTRVWKLEDTGPPKLIAGHASEIPNLAS